MPPSGPRAPDLGRLSDGARLLIEVATAFREPFEPQALVAVASSSSRPPDEAAAVVAELERRGLLTRVDGERVALPPEVRERLAGRTLPAAARGVQRAIGRYYAQAGPGREDRHRLGRAHAYLREAGAHRESLQVAMRLVPLLRREGDFEGMVRLMTQEAETAQGIDRLEVLVLLAEALLRVQRFGESFRLYELLLRAVSGRPEDRYRGVEAAGRVALGTFFFLDGSPVLARSSLETAVHLRRALRDPEGLSDALRRLAVLDLIEGEADRADQRAREALALARKGGAPEADVLASQALATVLGEAGDAASARAVLEEARPAAEAVGGPVADDLAHALRRAEHVTVLRPLEPTDPPGRSALPWRT